MRRVLLGIVLAAFVVTGIATADRLTWLLETFWIVLAVPLLLATWRRFPLTTLLCCLLAVHALILIYGGMYTYARTPLGNWVRDALDLSRNPYDRLGHFAQGFVPAILVRELLVRLSRCAAAAGSRRWSSAPAWRSARSSRCSSGGVR
ncbi:DUF2238 domain-containing protein [Luedemannella flava]